MKWLATIAAMLAIGMAGITPVRCVMPAQSQASFSKSCACCEGSGSTCCMQTEKTTPSSEKQAIALPGGSIEVGILPASRFCIGEIAAWRSDDFRPFIHGQYLPNARLTYQRIQIFLI
ncbi:MAG: hypothetical protein ABI615_00575 [Chthoniobacterales bacterium]